MIMMWSLDHLIFYSFTLQKKSSCSKIFLSQILYRLFRYCRCYIMSIKPQMSIKTKLEIRPIFNAVYLYTLWWLNSISVDFAVHSLRFILFYYLIKLMFLLYWAWVDLSKYTMVKKILLTCLLQGNLNRIIADYSINCKYFKHRENLT